MYRQVKNLLPVFALVVALTLSSMFVVYLAGVHLSVANARLIQTQEVLSALNGLSSAFKDAELGQRGFLHTGDEADLELYETAEEHMGKELDRLDSLAGSGQVDPARAQTVQHLLEEILGLMQHSIQERREKGVEADTTLMSTGAGKALKGRLQDSISQLIEEERRELALTRRQRDRIQTLRTRLAVVMAAIEVLFFLWAFLRIRDAVVRTERQRRTLAVTLSSIGDGVIVTDAEGRVSFLNPQAEFLTGWNCEEARGQLLETVFRIVRPETGKAAGFPNSSVLITKDGVERPIDDSHAPIKEGQEATRGMVLVFRDMSERHNAEEALRESEERLRFALETSRTGAWELNLGDLTSRRSLEHDRTFGYDQPLPQWTYNMFLEHILPEDRAAVEAKFHEATTQHGDWNFECRIRRADGEVRWIWAAGRYREAPAGGPGRIVGIVQDITGRKQAEETLRESEARFRVMADGLPHMIWVTGTDGAVQFVNRAYCEFFGMDVDWTKVPDWHCFVHPDDAPAYTAAFQQTLQTRRPFHAQARVRRADGEWRWVDSYAVPRLSADGAFIGFVGSSPDITDAKRTQEHLREVTQRLNYHVDHSPLGVIEWGPDLRIIRWSGEAEHIFGWTTEEALGRQIDDFPFVYPADQAQVKEVIAALITGANSRRFSANRNHRKDGSVVYCEWYSSSLFEESGNLLSVLSLVLDVTERKRAEEALRNSQERNELLAQIVELSSQGFCLGDASGHLFQFNSAYERLTGYSADELKPINWMTDLTPPEWRDFELAQLEEVKRTGRPLRYEKEYIRKDGQRVPIELLVHYVEGAAGKPEFFHAFVTDNTERKRGREELEAARARAECAMAAAEEANKAKDRFLAVLSHELRTPLTPVLAAVSMLQKQGSGLDPGLRNTISMVRRNIEVEARLIDDLLDLTRIAQGKVELDKQPTDLLTIIHQAVEICMPDLLARNIDLTIEAPDAPYPLEADAARMQQVFWNLLRNATKFTPVGGRISVRCHREGKDGVVVEVSDTGEGIAPELLPRLFNAFEQGEQGKHRQFGGLGLGLAISKSFVELHGGTIEAFSEGAGRGATFTLRFQLQAPPGESVPDAEERVSASTPSTPKARGLSLLLVEDHGDTAALMKELLEMEGHHVQTASDVGTALDLAARQKFDMLISDLGLPDGSGIDLMRSLRERGQALPSIALSGYGQDADIQESRAAGFASHITKPVSVEHLLEVVEQVAASGTWVQSHS